MTAFNYDYSLLSKINLRFAYYLCRKVCIVCIHLCEVGNDHCEFPIIFPIATATVYYCTFVLEHKRLLSSVEIYHSILLLSFPSNVKWFWLTQL